MLRDVFRAISDPTRREIIKIVSAKPLNVNTIASNFEVTRTAIYKHLRVLTQCGLISMKQQGRESFCEAKLEKLNEIYDWLEPYRKHWSVRPEMAGDPVTDTMAKKKKGSKKK